MSFNVCVGKPVQYYICNDRRNPCPALVARVDDDGMLNLIVFNGGLTEYRAGVHHVSNSILEKNAEVALYGSWDHLIEDKVSPLDLPIGSSSEDKKTLPEPKRK